ncbi:Abi family protein [Vagococcus hydrophili]|uniref:Abi family protein n=1 Tax=Vagococcus hydrophili TaxID=2714947 RepID=A0A6G8AV96_9ENTE|nr:Abi family protein [Vagococcus hydrophili]QIL48910.1 Abi family protein [Vagococcus hydrophili]
MSKKTMLISDVSKPYQDIEVYPDKNLFIDGYKFPIPIKQKSKKIEIKEAKEIKIPKKIPEMIVQFKDHGITFTSSEEVLAGEILRTINYYRLSVFMLYLKEDKSFSNLLKLYEFDSFLRMSINRLIPSIEVLLKTNLAYFLSTNREILTNDRILPSGLIYLDKTIYKERHLNNKDVDRWYSKVAEELFKKQEKDVMIKHHVEYYSGHIPIWVMVEHLTIGELSSFITYLDRPIRKKWMDQLSEEIPQRLIIEWVKTIQILRNTGAHCSRFYSKYFNFNPTMLKMDEELIFKNIEYDKEQLSLIKSKFSHSVFAGLLVMKNFYMLLGITERENWNVFVEKLENKITDTPEVNISNMSFPKHWKEILIFEI